MLLYNIYVVTPFSTNALFTMRAINQLKVSAGIALVDELAQRNTAFLDIVGMDVRAFYQSILKKWSFGCGSHPPTWEELFQRLKAMGLSNLVIRIEKYMSRSVSECLETPDQSSEGEDLSEDEGNDLFAQGLYICLVN